MKTKQIVKYFGEQEVVFIEKNNELCLTAEQLGTALGYSEPRKGIMKVYERNKGVLENFTVVVKMTTTGGKKDVTAFKETGCYVIAIRANTAKSNKFVVWAAEIIRAYQHGLLVKKEKPQRPMSAAYLAEIRKLNPGRLSHTLWLRDNINFPVAPAKIVQDALLDMNTTPNDLKLILKNYGYDREVNFWVDINRGTFKEKERLSSGLGLTVDQIWGYAPPPTLSMSDKTDGDYQ